MTEQHSDNGRHGGEPDFDPIANPELAPEVDDPEIWLNNYLAHAQALEASAQRAEAQLDQIGATIENKFMRLTLGAGGTVSSLVFLGSANAATAAQLTDVFRETHAQAGAEVTRQTMAVLTTLAGPDDPTVRLVEKSVPENIREQLAADAADPDRTTPQRSADPDTTEEDDDEHDGTNHLGTF